MIPCSTILARFDARRAYCTMGTVLGLLSLSVGCGEVPIVEETDADGGLPTSPKVIHGDPDIHATFPWSASIIIPGHLSGCTATIISEHYLLTAAHCVSGLEGDTVSIDVTMPGGTRTLFQNAPARFFPHPDVATNNSDIALVYARGAVHEQSIDHRASFFADTRSPFNDGESDTVFFAGYGGGTDYGGPSSCTGAPDGTLRWSAAQLVSQGTGTSVQGLGYNTSASCRGDSGMGYFLQRPALGRNQAMLLYAVHSGTVAGTRKIMGFRTETVQSWILARILETSPFPIAQVRDHRGYTAAAYRERAIGPRTVVGPTGKCMTAVGDEMPVVLRTCDGSAGQQFTMQPNGMMQSLGLCVDVLNAIVGGTVRMRACNPLLPQRHVSLTRAGQITGPTSPSTGQCIGAPDDAPTEGTALTMAACVEGSSRQAFRWWNLLKPPRVILPGGEIESDGVLSSVRP